MDDDLDIFKFGSSSKLRPGALKPRIPSRVPALSGGGADSRRKPQFIESQGGNSSYSEEYSSNTNTEEDQQSSSCDDSEDESRPRRRQGRQRRRRQRKSSLAASRLLKKSMKSSDDEDLEAIEKPPPKKSKTCDSSSSSPSPSPSPPPNIPSPPPPGPYEDPQGPTPDRKARQILNQANDVLNRLMYTTPYSFSDYQSDLNDSPYVPPANAETMNLRVRWKGKIQKYSVNKCDPFSKVISLLSRELKVSDGNHILLSHKTTTITPTTSPASLGLTTADIIDAVVMSGSIDSSLNDSQSSASGQEHITIKVQTSNKSMKYSLAKTDPLQKAMTAFASELEVDITKLKFSFDGDTIGPSQTALDLDMENDDCIDVII